MFPFTIGSQSRPLDAKPAVPALAAIFLDEPEASGPAVFPENKARVCIGLLSFVGP